MIAETGVGTLYDPAYFAGQADGSLAAARIVVPLLLDIVEGVGSVVDIGCGTGTWLAVFREHGVVRVLGVDGGAADPAQLRIDPAEFHSRDLEAPIRLDARFDLVISVEVAEHLHPRRAAGFVADLCALADIVAFGAALPGQGGTGHVNEAWPTRWAELFAEQGYALFDVLRPRLWYDERVEFWYRQNTLIFASEHGRARLRLPSGFLRWLDQRPMNLVHPDLLRIRAEELAWAGEKLAATERRIADLQRGFAESREYWQAAEAALRAERERIRAERDAATKAAHDLGAHAAALEAELDRTRRDWQQAVAARDALMSRIPLRLALKLHRLLRGFRS